MQSKGGRIAVISLVAAVVLVAATIFLSPAAHAQPAGRTRDFVRELEWSFYSLQSNYVDEVDPSILIDGARDGLIQLFSGEGELEKHLGSEFYADIIGEAPDDEVFSFVTDPRLQNSEITSEDLFEAAINGMFAALDDPYSIYLSGEILTQMNDTTEGEYGGVGLYISKDRFDPENPNGRRPYVKVISPIENTPGWRSGINAGDYIFAIEEESAKDFTTQDVMDRLRGPPGSDVNVTVLRGEDITFTLTLTRELIEIPTVKTAVIDNETGYLRIIEFTRHTSARVEEALEEFASLGLTNLIIDVRSNPGGLLDSVVDVADNFFSGGVIVSTRYRRSRYNKIHRAAPGKIVSSDTDIVVLIDRGSASASEILTGAMKDRGRAVVIGETSFGKGSIQQLTSVGESILKLTTGRYYTPNGENIDKTGIEPDIFVEETPLSEAQQEAYASLLQQNRVGLFIDSNPIPSENQVRSFIRLLQEEGLDPGERIIRLMIKRESQRRMNVPPVIDLEFDRVLLRALTYLETGE